MALAPSSRFSHFFLLAILSYWLIFSLLISSLQSLHFLIFGFRNQSLVFLGLFLFICFLTCLLISSTFKQKLFEFLVNSYVNRYCTKVVEFVRSFSKKHPSASFFLFHFYLCLLFVHTGLLYQGINDDFVEYPFYFLNLIKILFFPLIIVSFLYKFAPYSSELANLLDKQVSRHLGDALEYVAEFGNVKKNPRTALALYTSGLVFYAGNTYGEKLENDVKKLASHHGIDLKNRPGWDNSELPGSEELLNKTNRLLSHVIVERPLTLFREDAWSLLSGKPTFREKAERLMCDYTMFENKHSLIKRKESAEQLKMSPLAFESLKEKIEIPIKTKSPEISSIVEAFIF